MNIKDIRFDYETAYLEYDDGTVHTQHLPMSLQQCEANIAKIRYYARQDALDEKGVESTEWPPVVYPFYQILLSEHRIPFVSVLLDAYYKTYADQITISGEQVCFQSKMFLKKDVDGRLMRTYPSLIRDFHFYLMLLDDGCFEELHYSCRADIDGKDIIVKNNDFEYQVSLYVNTRRSRDYKEKKNKYRHEYGKEIQLPLDLHTARKCGDVFLYDRKDVERIKIAIRTFEAEAMKVNCPGKPIGAMEVDDHIQGYYFLKSPMLSITRDNKPYLRGELKDKTGVMDFRAWDYCGEIGAGESPSVVYVVGRVKEYFGKLQMQLDTIVYAGDNPGPHIEKLKELGTDIKP